MHLIFRAGTLPAKDLVDNGKIPKKIWWIPAFWPIKFGENELYMTMFL